jgi:Ca2+-binding RTX toxin-like protein
MKNSPNKIILQLLVLAVVALLIPITASAHCAGKHTGNHPHCSSGSGEIHLGSADDDWPGADDNSGDDVVYGGDGNDTLMGGLGNDALYGEAGDDNLFGGDGDDNLTGGDGLDNLFGGEGSDHLRTDLSGVVIDGIEQGDFADGGSSVNENGKEHKDYMHLGHLDFVEVIYDEPGVSLGIYAGSYARKGKNRGVFPVEGGFQNIKFIYGTPGNDTYVGNDLDNEVWGQGGDDTFYGMGGNDSMRGGYEVEFFDGGEGNDNFTGLDGDDYFIGGTGSDKFWTRRPHGHDIWEDFVSGEDLIIIYNSNVCWEDLRLSMVDADGDSNVDDLRVEWESKPVTSLTFLDVNSVEETDFNFEHDNNNYGGCL